MKSPVVKRSIVVAGHKTSVSLEEAFWTSMREIAEQRGMGLSKLITTIDDSRHGNLSSAIRLFVLDHFRSRALSPARDSRQRAGHAPEEPLACLESRSRH